MSDRYTMEPAQAHLHLQGQKLRILQMLLETRPNLSAEEIHAAAALLVAWVMEKSVGES